MSLYRSSTNKVFGGVCGGIAEALNLNPTGLRWLIVIISLFTGLPVLVYLVLWTILKKR